MPHWDGLVLLCYNIFMRYRLCLVIFFFFRFVDKDETSYLFNLNSFYHISSSQYFEIEAPINHSRFKVSVSDQENTTTRKEIQGVVAEIHSSLILKK